MGTFGSWRTASGPFKHHAARRQIQVPEVIGYPHHNDTIFPQTRNLMSLDRSQKNESKGIRALARSGDRL